MLQLLIPVNKILCRIAPTKVSYAHLALYPLLLNRFSYEGLQYSEPKYSPNVIWDFTRFSIFFR